MMVLEIQYINTYIAKYDTNGYIQNNLLLRISMANASEVKFEKNDVTIHLYWP